MLPLFFSSRPPFPARGRQTLLTALLAVVLGLPAVPGQAQLPGLGDGAEISLAAERRLGERIARELYRDPDYLDDPVLTEYVQDIWQPLLASARQRGELSPELEERFAWDILLGRDRSVNAFALPGAYLGVHLGLIAVVSTRDELASVLAHELSHVTQRHIARLMTRQGQQTPLLLASIILGMLAASKSPDAANALIMGGQAVSAQGQLNFSRDMEREADRVGYGVMTQAGFAPQGFVGMFGKLQAASRLNDFGNYPYLRTHPLTTERIADMQARHQLSPAGSAPADAGRTATDMSQAMMAARARMLARSKPDDWRNAITEAQASSFSRQPAERQAGILYAAVWASQQLRETATTASLLARLTAQTRDDRRAARLARLLAIELALASGQGQQAWSMADAANGGAGRRADLLLWAQAGIQAGQGAEVAQRLKAWTAESPRDASAWQLLGTAYASQGLTLRSVRAEAESRAVQLDYQAALDRLRAGQDAVRRRTVPADDIEAAIIDTRVRQLQSLLREQAIER